VLLQGFAAALSHRLEDPRPLLAALPNLHRGGLPWLSCRGDRRGRPPGLTPLLPAAVQNKAASGAGSCGWLDPTGDLAVVLAQPEWAVYEIPLDALPLIPPSGTQPPCPVAAMPQERQRSLDLGRSLWPPPNLFALTSAAGVRGRLSSSVSTRAGGSVPADTAWTSRAPHRWR